MSDINTVTMTGRLIRDPETRTVGSKETVLTDFAIANNYWNGKEEAPNFFDVKAWGKLGEVCGKYLTKGRQITVEAELRQERWESDDGSTRSKVILNARNISFGSGGGEGDSNGGEKKSKSSGKKSTAKSQPSQSDDEDLPF